MAERPEDQARKVDHMIAEAERLGEKAKRTVDELVALLTARTGEAPHA